MPPHPTDAEPCREPEAQQSVPENEEEKSANAGSSAAEERDEKTGAQVDVKHADDENSEKASNPDDGTIGASPETEGDLENAALLKGWRIHEYEPSLCELNGSVRMPGTDSAW